jgi:hypothetical protein
MTKNKPPTSCSDVLAALPLPCEIGFKDFRHEWEERNRRANSRNVAQ